MIADAQERGRALAAFFRAVSPRLLRDLAESGVLPPRTPEERVRAEWECFALYACVRGLVAAGGFNRETAGAIDALHDDVLSTGDDEVGGTGRRARISERYAEYGGIGQAGGASGAGTVTRRLGEAAARHIAESDPPPAELAEVIGALHESLAEAAAEAVKREE